MTNRFRVTSSEGLTGAGLSVLSAHGKGGMVAAGMKREGDGASPLGVWTMTRVFWRPDRLSRPETGLSCIPLRPHDGWCDDPADPLYNRPVRLPYPASCERLWREDPVYDIIVVLDHNSDPVVPGAGSAIFFHLAWPDYRDTEGCIAVAKLDMLDILARCGPGSTLEIAA